MSKFYVDTHCHLDLIQGIPERVSLEDSLPIKTITVTNAPSFFQPNNTLFKHAKNIRVALGLHPELSNEFSNELPKFLEYIESSRFVGEIGLDGSSRFKKNYAKQELVFEEILKSIAKSSGKIITIHSRNAASEVLNLLNKYKITEKHKVIFHWYSGDIKSLNRAVEMGIYFSINHKMLQTSTGSEIVKSVPLEFLLTETDAPFTFDSSVKTRMDSLKLSCELIAKVLEKSTNEVVDMIWTNFKMLLK